MPHRPDSYARRRTGGRPINGDPLSRAAYRIAQGARAGLFWSQYLLSARLTKPVSPDRPIEGPVPDRKRILADLRALFARDLANIEAGRYRLPHDIGSAPLRALGQTPRYFADLRSVEARRHARSYREIDGDKAAQGRYPRYYLQNFHYQSDGYLSRDSAEIYDHQVEVLFGGGADAMRRQALPALAEIMAGRDQRGMKLIDLGAGTGRFLAAVKNNYPRLNVTALDLSEPYLEVARRTLKPWRGVRFEIAAAEDTGLPAGSFDIASSVYLFHELPQPVRKAVVCEAHRLLAPGGYFILVDSIQRGDAPDYDGMLDYFPVAFHEPYYADYLRQDLSALFAEAGFEAGRVELAYLSKVMVFRKACQGSPAST